MAVFTKAGCRYISKDERTILGDLSPHQRRLNEFFNEFKNEHFSLFTFRFNYLHFLVPYSDPRSFFDLLFLESSLERKFTMILRYVNFDILNNIYGDNSFWIDFYSKFRANKDSFNRDLLTLFVNIFVNFDDASFIYTGGIQYIHPDRYTIDSAFKASLL